MRPRQFVTIWAPSNNLGTIKMTTVRSAGLFALSEYIYLRLCGNPVKVSTSQRLRQATASLRGEQTPT
jgi:hypothetical protein